MSLITGSDALVLMLHEEVRSWRQRGVEFVLTTDGTISLVMNAANRELMRAAQRYRSEHAADLRRYLAFVSDRDPDDAMKHLEFAWGLRKETMAEEYIPHKIAPLKREEDGLLRKLDANKREGAEIEAKLTEVRNRIKETMGEE